MLASFRLAAQAIVSYVEVCQAPPLQADRFQAEKLIDLYDEIVIKGLCLHILMMITFTSTILHQRLS